MVIFHSYVKLPEGISPCMQFSSDKLVGLWVPEGKTGPSPLGQVIPAGLHAAVNATT